ncbi:uncharacterized protein UHOD_00154 [Ustilago sp. UG-2017b]|nr:uncharacterized protein UHOD_00154 [Ustilago sp. UG-2017b]
MTFFVGASLYPKVQKNRLHFESPEPEISDPTPTFYPTFHADTGRPSPPEPTNMVVAMHRNDTAHDKGRFDLLSPPSSAPTSGDSARSPKRPYRRMTQAEQDTIIALAMNGKKAPEIARLSVFFLEPSTGVSRSRGRKVLLFRKKTLEFVLLVSLPPLRLRRKRQESVRFPFFLFASVSNIKEH